MRRMRPCASAGKRQAGRRGPARQRLCACGSQLGVAGAHAWPCTSPHDGETNSFRQRKPFLLAPFPPAPTGSSSWLSKILTKDQPTRNCSVISSFIQDSLIGPLISADDHLKCYIKIKARTSSQDDY